VFGRRRLLAVGIAVFGAASLLCGFAATPSLLIVGRAIAGIGAALALPGSLAVLRVAYTDPAERTRALGIWAGINGVAVALGPALGGVLVDSLGWRSIFLVAVPLGGLALALTFVSIRESADPAGRRLDVPGQLLAVLGLGCLATGAISGETVGWLSAPILVALALGGALLIGFVRVEARSHSPLLPLETLRNRALSGSLGAMTAVTFGMYGMLLLVPLYLQSILGLAPAAAGLALVPSGILFAVISSFAGRIVARVGARLPISAGMALAGLGLAVIAVAGLSSDLTVIVLGVSLTGVALGLLTGPLMAVAVGNVAPERAGLASGLINVGRMVGATFGVAILGSVFAAFSHASADPHAFGMGIRAALLIGAVAEWLGSVLAMWTIGPAAERGAQRTSTPPNCVIKRSQYA
jgi:EmrB/QacA subfamily drug resistance transporter